MFRGIARHPLDNQVVPNLIELQVCQVWNLRLELVAREQRIELGTENIQISHDPHFEIVGLTVGSGDCKICDANSFSDDANLPRDATRGRGSLRRAIL